MTDVQDTVQTAPPVRILIVDDNRIYRDAFRRNLLLNGYDVLEAEDTEEALARMQEAPPDVVVTDLQMRTETEGLDLIRAIKSLDPLLPVIMISAVGTFEEGALATRYGASAVLSKSRIEDEIDRLYAAIDSARGELERARNQAVCIESARGLLTDSEGDPRPALDTLRPLLTGSDIHPYVRSEAYALSAQLNERALRDAARQAAATAAQSSGMVGGMAPMNLEAVEGLLRRELPAYDSFQEDSKESLRIAEFLYEQQASIPGSIDFSRNVGFSYCFAVENEVKTRMSKRLQKFLGSDMTYALLGEMMENRNQNLSVYYHQHLLLLLRGQEMDFTIDNVKQTFRRILEHQSRYKPDGLKALGIIVIAFGRNYSWTREKRTIRVGNPLGLKGLDPDQETLRFAELLISLQHYRNPYIHPEISDLEKLSKIRSTSLECLNMASRLH